jgi:hypothetical protein
MTLRSRLRFATVTVAVTVTGIRPMPVVPNEELRML